MRSKANEVRYLGMKNGRPEFDFGMVAPPDWLVKALKGTKTAWDGGTFNVNRKPVEQGEMVRREECE